MHSEAQQNSTTHTRAAAALRHTLWFEYKTQRNRLKRVKSIRRQSFTPLKVDVVLPHAEADRSPIVALQPYYRNQQRMEQQNWFSHSFDGFQISRS
ncbi:unnamed protein product [Ceratitis capitata]|uniref:(Mediterranean fruit fly) hypothetical protein n=1 Tax=Ceratitis capitata TaxID=7213 RepID=A0A811VGG5_CERCA|nr:unnamed protein product [Ceratitis capitata]